MLELKGNKFPVGAFINEARESFTTQTFLLKKNDSIYLFTDGYADQFGGPKDKKFKIHQLKELLKNISSLNANDQIEKLGITFNDWKANTEQVDDVLIIGINID